MKKTLQALSLIVALLSLFAVIPVSASAATANDQVAPCWDNTFSTSCKVSFPEQGRGIAQASIVGHLTVNHIEADVYLYRQVGNNWVYVAENHGSVDKPSMILTCEFTPVAGAYYRADFTMVITKNGVDEVLTDTAYNTYTGT